MNGECTDDTYRAGIRAATDDAPLIDAAQRALLTRVFKPQELLARITAERPARPAVSTDRQAA